MTCEKKKLEKIPWLPCVAMCGDCVIRPDPSTWPDEGRTGIGLPAWPPVGKTKKVVRNPAMVRIIDACTFLRRW